MDLYVSTVILRRINSCLDSPCLLHLPAFQQFLTDLNKKLGKFVPENVVVKRFRKELFAALLSDLRESF